MDVVLCLAFIEKDRMYTENANRSSGDGIITPDNMEPNPKNPIIASFFRNIGWSDRLGSGVRNIFKYSKYYSGEEPEFIEGDVFRLIVPLNEDYSYDNVKNGDKKTAIKNGDKKISKKTIQNYKKILEFMEEGKEYTIQDEYSYAAEPPVQFRLSHLSRRSEPL